MRLFLLWLMFAYPWLLSANPLAGGPSAESGYPDAGGYQGRFHGDGLGLNLEAGTDNSFRGEIRRGDQSYPLRAELTGKQLRGHFFDREQSYPFTLFQRNQFLWLETGGTSYRLQREAAAPQPSPLPPANPLGKASPGPPMTPSPSPSVPSPSVGEPPRMGMRLPAPPGMTDNPFEHYRELSEQVRADFGNFLAALRQWTQGESASTSDPVRRQLLPLSLGLKNQLHELTGLSARMSQAPGMKPKEISLLRSLGRVSETGAGYFASWHELFQQLLALNQRGEQEKLRTLAAERLPVAARNTLTLARNLTMLLQWVDKLEKLKTGGNSPASRLEPSKLLKWETLRNMSEMMRDGMRILKDRRQK